MSERNAPQPPPPNVSEVLAACSAGSSTLPESANNLMAVVAEMAQSRWLGVRWQDCKAITSAVDGNFAGRKCPLFFDASRWQQYELIYDALCLTVNAQAAAWLFRLGAEQRAAAERRRPLRWRTNVLDSMCIDGRSTPLIAAVMCGVLPVDLVNMIGHGATVDGTDVDGQTALHHAVLFRFKPKEVAYSTDTVELLLEKGAPLNVRNAEGLTPLDLAIRRRRSRLIKPLVLAGAKANSAKQFASVLRIATEQGWRNEMGAIEAAWSEVAFRLGFPPAQEWRKSEGGRF